MKLKFLRGTTSKLLRVFIQDSSKTDGSGLANLTSASTGLTWYYCREGDAASTSVSLVAATLGTYTSGGFVAVDNTNMPGCYELGVPDAAIGTATSAASVLMMLKGATNMAPVLIEIELDLVNYQDGVRAGLTALPNAAAAATGGLLTAGTGTNQLSTASGAVLLQNGTGTGQLSLSLGTVTVGAVTSGVIAADVWNAAAASYNTANTMGAKLNSAGGGGSVTVAAYSAGQDPATLVWNALRTSFTAAGSFGQGVASVQGNVTGSVGSVTGSVGSVTGSVGSVTGSVTVGAVTSGVVAADVWNAARSSYTAAGSFGQGVASVQGSVTGSVGSVTGSVGSVTGSVTVGAVTSGVIAADVWNAVATSYNTAGSMGAKLNSAASATGGSVTVSGYSGGQDPATLVWNALRSSFTAAGSFGQGIASVQGSVTGSVASVTGSVASVTAAVVVGSVTSGVIAADVWNATAASYNTANTMGARLNGAQASGNVTVGGYAGGQDPATLVWNAARSSFTTAGTFGQGVASVQGNVTGSVASVTGSVGSVTGSVGSVTGSVGSVTASVTVGAVTAGVVAADVWNAVATSYNTAGSMGAKLNSAASATDPWSTALPGSYVSGTAGYIVGSILNATHYGLGQTGSTTTSAVLNASASSTNGWYVGQILKIIGGTGLGEVAVVTAYNGTSKAATLVPALATSPDTTSVFAILPHMSPSLNSSLQVSASSATIAGNVTVGGYAGGQDPATLVWNAARSSFTTAGTFGQGVASVQGNVTGSVASVTGSVGSVTGSVGSVTASVTVGAVTSGVMAADVWNAARSSYTGAGSFGQGVASVQGNVTGSVASVTGAVGSVTASVTVGAVTSGVIAADIWNALATSYNTASSMGAKLNGAQVAGNVTVGGYVGGQDPATLVWNAARASFTTAGTFGQGVASVQGNVTGSVASVTGAVGSVASSVTVGVVTAGVIAADVWNATATSYNTAGSMGAKLNSAASATDPWSTALPGSYVSGTAGYIVGSILNATHYGLGQTGSTTTSAVLNASASATNSWYVGQTLKIIGGTGLGQVAVVTAYNGTSKAATLAPALATSPDTTSVFAVLPRMSPTLNASLQVSASSATVSGNVTVGAYASGQDPATLVWNAVRSSFTTAGSFGQGVASVQGNVTGSVGSVTGSVTVGAVTSGVIAADVWNALRSSYVTAGSFGQGVASVQGSVTGSVGSVTGSVGSVTGSVTVGAVTSGVIAADVWNALAASYNTVSSMGAKLNGVMASGNVTVGAYASGQDPATLVWNAARASFTTAGTFGQGVASVQGNVTGSVVSVTGSVGSVTGSVTVGAVTSGVVAADVWNALRSSYVTAGSFGQGVASVQGSVTGSVGSVTGAVGSVTAPVTVGAVTSGVIAADVWNALAASYNTANSMGAKLNGVMVSGNVTVGAYASGQDPSTLVWGATTRSLTDKANFTLASGEYTTVADTLLKRDLSLVTGEALRSPLNALRALRNKVTTSGGILKVMKEDDATQAWQANLTVDASASPITGVTPS